jgi:hypothetical protein
MKMKKYVLMIILFLGIPLFILLLLHWHYPPYIVRSHRIQDINVGENQDLTLIINASYFTLTLQARGIFKETLFEDMKEFMIPSLIGQSLRLIEFPGINRTLFEFEWYLYDSLSSFKAVYTKEDIIQLFGDNKIVYVTFLWGINMVLFLVISSGVWLLRCCLGFVLKRRREK